ncbi:MAG: hypothetical protein NDJ24_04550 [Alphaproteobacteria bacterium]|nr:hypothetical protein [Alphaproteobacteria bacterium]
MGCSIINDTIHLHVESTRQDMDVLLPSRPGAQAKTKITAGSALQNPDLSKMSLSAMLRRVRQDATLGGQKNYWSAFMERTQAHCANGNSSEQA